MKRKITIGVIIIVILVAVYFLLFPSKTTGGQADNPSTSNLESIST